MDFSLNQEQKIFQDAVRAFAERHLAEGALQRAHSNEYPWDVAKLMSDQGLIGITTSEENGGIGGSLMDAVLAIQEIAKVCPRWPTWSRPATSAQFASWRNMRPKIKRNVT